MTPAKRFLDAAELKIFRTTWSLEHVVLKDRETLFVLSSELAGAPEEIKGPLTTQRLEDRAAASGILRLSSKVDLRIRVPSPGTSLIIENMSPRIRVGFVIEGTAQ